MRSAPREKDHGFGRFMENDYLLSVRLLEKNYFSAPETHDQLAVCGENPLWAKNAVHFHWIPYTNGDVTGFWRFSENRLTSEFNVH